MTRVTARRLKKFVHQRLRLRSYLRKPGDGRVQPQIRAEDLVWSQIMARILREPGFHAIEALVKSSARRSLAVGRSFGDDALAYFSEKQKPAVTRNALVSLVKLAKRNKAFQNSRRIGLAFDGSCACRCSEKNCYLCLPYYGPQKVIAGYHHKFTLVSVVGAGLSLPFDVAPYGKGGCEYTSSQRLLKRAVMALGPRFADYAIGDGEYATAPWLHRVGEFGLRAIARLKGNLPDLMAAAEARFAQQPPSNTFRVGKDWIEVWDADDFDPWDSLKWTTVRVLKYRQHKPDGQVVEAYWLTDFTTREAGSRELYLMAKSRWEIENQGFNDGKNRYGMEHLAHHHENSLVMGWLLALLAMVIERLYRLRYLHRGTHPVMTAIELVRALWLALGSPVMADTS